MLNKLLKRCMPWMDKGKWVRILVDWRIGASPVVTAPEWLHATVNNNYLVLNPSGCYFIKEIMPTHVGVPEGITGVFQMGHNFDYVTDGYPLDIFQGSIGYIDIFINKPGIAQLPVIPPDDN